MEQKKSGLGITTGILFGVNLLYSVASFVSFLSRYPEMYLDVHHLIGYIPDILGWCISVFIIISLFREKRSKLLIAAHVLDVLLFVQQLINDRYFSVAILTTLIYILLTAIMVIFCCTPSLQEHAGWTGKIWFLPSVFCSITAVLNAIQNWEMYRDGLLYHTLWTAEQLFVNFIAIILMFLFCLWLTEPVRIQKIGQSASTGADT